MTLMEFMADLVMVMHAAFSVFLVGGLVLIITGMILRWDWIRRRRFCTLHLVATLFIVARVWLGFPCPFSVAEDALRRGTTAEYVLGRPLHDGLHQLAFRGEEPQRFGRATTTFGLLVVVLYVVNLRPQMALEQA